MRLCRAYRDHYDAVHLTARRLCGPVWADDVAQEVFLRLWRNPSWFDPARGTLRALLVVAARHRAIDVWRADSSRRIREQRSVEALSRTNPPPFRAADSKAVRSSEESWIAGAVWALPVKEREALAAAFYGQRTYKEAALALGESEGTVKARIRSGLRRLSVSLGETRPENLDLWPS